MSKDIEELTSTLADAIAALPLDKKVEALNSVRQRLATSSPFSAEPVDCVLWVPAKTVQANTYNPNSVAPPEMALLELSILEDGYTQPIVVNPENDKYIVVDGFHRNRVGKESAAVSQRIHGYLPVVAIRTGKTDTDRMASTIRHNRARGEHGTEKMGQLVKSLVNLGQTDSYMQKHLGMEGEEVLRLRHLAKAAKVLSAQQYNRTWELTEDAKPQ